MSNRAKWAHGGQERPKSDRARIPVGLTFLILGGVLFFGAIAGMGAHIFIFPAFDFRFGTVVIGQTVGLLVLGAALIIAGMLALFVRS